MGMNDRNLAQRVGAAIAARRKQRGYTQSQLAERLSISQEALSRMEKGIISPKFSRLEDLADALGCTVAELFHAPSDTTRARGMTLADIIRPLSPKSQDAVVDLISLMVQTFEIQYRYGIFDQHASADRKLERSDGPPPRFPSADMRPLSASSGRAACGGVPRIFAGPVEARKAADSGSIARYSPDRTSPCPKS